MTAPDFKTRVTELISYGVSQGFLLEDITLAYDDPDNLGGWDPDGGTGPNLAPEDILYAMIQLIPFEAINPINILLEMTDTGDDFYWENLLTHLTGEGITFSPEDWGATEVVNGYWQIKSYFWPGYYNSAFTYDVDLNPGTGFELGEIVKGVSGATGYLVSEVGSTAKHIAWIQGTFTNGEVITGQTSGAVVTIDTFSIVGEILTDEVYSYTNHQSFLTETRNTIRKLPLDAVLPRINEKHVHYIGMCDMLLETLDDAVEVGQIDNYVTIFNFVKDLIDRINVLYCND